MSKHNIFDIKDRDTISDALTEMLRTGANQLIRCSPKSSNRFTTSGRRKPGQMQKGPTIYLSRLTTPNTRKPLSACKRIGILCWRFIVIPPLITDIKSRGLRHLQ